MAPLFQVGRSRPLQRCDPAAVDQDESAHLHEHVRPRLVEPAAVTCSTLAIILAFFLFRSLLQNYADLVTVNLTAVVAFLGTPAWAYGRTLFSEPYLLLFAVGAYWASLRKRNPFLSGVFIALEF